MKKQLIYNYLNDDELLRISKEIKRAEQKTSGEIAVSIKEYDSLFKRKSVRELAAEEFNKLGIDKTQDAGGILIYLNLKRKEFYILADKAINEKVSQSVWDEVSREMQNNFLHGKFADGIIQSVKKVGNILAEHFPIKPNDKNELSNRVNI